MPKHTTTREYRRPAINKNQRTQLEALGHKVKGVSTRHTTTATPGAPTKKGSRAKRKKGYSIKQAARKAYRALTRPASTGQ